MVNKKIGMSSLLILFCLNVCDAKPAASVGLSHFNSDGCTGVPTDLPNFNGIDDFAHCCFAHDLKYWIGGTVEQKQIADKELNLCFNDVSIITLFSNVPTIAALELVGVDHWGAGWGDSAGQYIKLSAAEIHESKLKLNKIKSELDDYLIEWRTNSNQRYYILDQIDFWKKEISSSKF